VVCLCLVTTVSTAKTAGPIEMPFERQTCLGPVSHVLLDGLHILPPGLAAITDNHPAVNRTGSI